MPLIFASVLFSSCARKSVVLEGKELWSFPQAGFACVDQVCEGPDLTETHVVVGKAWLADKFETLRECQMVLEAGQQ